jgi:hypothetical protein
MNKTVSERVPGELTGEDDKTYTVELDLTIIEMYVDDGGVLAKRVIDRHLLAPRSGGNVPDGSYTLTFMFDGVPQKHNVRKSGRSLLVGQKTRR